ncbi:MAG: TlpA family protein disulfide reductase [Acidobacteriota bacterium]|nr:TlpA family protein disulfide reductase [Acidobacteriota bacterium]
MRGRKAKQARKKNGVPVARRRWLSERRLAYLAATIAVVVAALGGFAIANKNGAAPAEALSALAGSVSQAGGGAPAIHGTDPITGQQVSLAQFAGKPVVLNVWASWCTGCNQEAADLARFAARHRGAQVLGVDTQDTTGGARAFYRKWHWHHPSIADPSGSLSAQLAVTGLPTTYFLDARHRVVGKIVGAGNLAEFEQGLRLALRRS